MTTTDQLAVRFTRDAVPLLTGLRGHAVRLTRDPDLADDLLQETAAKAFAAFANFTEGTNLAGWLYRIMVNTHIGEYRKGRRRPALQVTDAISDTLMLSHHQRATSARSPEDDVLVRLGDPVIAAAMRALPEVYRTAVYYADVEGLTFKEIAARLDIPLGTVMSRLHRGRTQLRSTLRDTARAVGYSLPDAA